MKSCNEYQEMLASYLDHTGSPKEQELLLAHFASCETCRRQAQELSALLSFLSSMEEEDPPADLHGKIMDAVAAAPKKKTIHFNQRLISLGAVAACAAIFFAVWGPGYLKNHSTASSDMTASLAAPKAAAPMMRAAGAPEAAAEDSAGREKIAPAPSSPAPATQENSDAVPQGGTFGIQATPAPPMAPMSPPSPSAAAISESKASREGQGFCVRISTGGSLSKTEVASLLGIPLQGEESLLTISKDLLPRLRELSEEYHFSLDIITYDDNIPSGVVEVLD